MADIKVKTNSNQLTVRVGQQNAIKVVASNTAASISNVAMDDINDVDITNRANRTFLMYDSTTQTYVHVDAAQIVDLSDNVDNDSYDAGTF